MPFEWRAPIPYLAAVIFEIGVGSHTAVIYVITILLYVGLCVFLTTFATELEEKLQLFEMDNIHGSQQRSKEKRVSIKKKLCEFIQLHADTTQLSLLNNLWILSLSQELLNSCHMRKSVVL